jgi:UDP-N-acetylmuramoylalanine--D-glutamate ligase
MKHAAIIGYGKSGAAAARILKLQGYDSIDLFDDRKEGCKLFSEYADNYDMTVISPGVPLNLLPVVPAVYTSEIDLAYSELPVNSKVLGVTGTNGKSTVTHLAAQILNNAGVSAVACGNIGYPFADAVLDKPADVYVVELSSFQIELLKDLRLAGATLINITPDHLDRYASYDEYVAAKLRIIDFIEPDGAFIADPDPLVVNKVLRAPYAVHYVDKELKGWPELQGSKLVFSGNGFYVDTAEFKLFGWHNLINLSFALGLASTVLQDDDKKLARNATHVIAGLTGMPHRTETVLVHKGVTWINDSKATNVDSTLIALKGCQQPTIVMLGGKDKNSDYTALVAELDRAASLVIAFGGAADIIMKQLAGKLKCPLVKAAKLRNAVEMAYKEAKENSTVLLSPACASFDEFNNFEERGHRFAEYVKEVCGC